MMSNPYKLSPQASIESNVRYGTLLIDPPWLERGGGKIKRGADRHYKLMKTNDIRDLLVIELSSKLSETCHCWMWVTNNFLQDGLYLMKELGFRYITNIVWVKDRIGLGQYVRGMHELCLFGVRGPTYLTRNTVRSVINAPRRKHSQKPEEIYEIAERLSPQPRLEFFARSRREGWDAFGDEI